MNKMNVWGGALLAGLLWGGMCVDMPFAWAAVQSVPKQTDAVQSPAIDYGMIAERTLSWKDDYGSQSMTLHADGSFEGEYTYYDKYIPAGEVYPNCYQAKFRGQLGKMEKVNAYTYMLPLRKAEYLDSDKMDSVKNGLKYVQQRRYDFDNMKRLYLYLPGTPLEYLPAFFNGMEWNPNKKLEGYVLAEPLTQLVWVSAPVPLKQRIVRQDGLTKAELQREIAFYEEEQQELQAIADGASASQMLYNLAAFRLYDMWNIEMIRICQALEREMSAEELAAFSKKQAKWQQRREDAMEKEGRKWAGGTGEGAARASVGTMLTKKRVYELYHLLKEK